jgi:hypothetical protein
MGYIAIPLGRMRPFRDDFVSVGLADAFPVQNDFERP